MNTIETRVQKFLTDIKLNEETISTVLGLMVVLVVGSLIFNYFREFKKTAQITDQAASTVNTNIKIQPQDPETTQYIVKSGESLEFIAQKLYGDSALWPQIAQINQISSPDLISDGQQLLIPNIDNKIAGVFDETQASSSANPILEPEILTANQIEAIKENEYVIKEGDSLQSIAERAYGNADRWPEISQANHILYPDYLEVGTKIIIPR